LAETEFWSQEFSITSVTRSDLVSAGIPRKAVRLISDEQMQKVASKMEDYYCDHGYWEDVRAAVAVVLALTETGGETDGEEPTVHPR
jgi:hypothetical protein